MLSIKNIYKSHNDRIFSKRYNSSFPLRQYTHRTKYQSIINKINQGENVLDVGCGDGVLPILLTEKGFDVTACDISEPNIVNAKKMAEEKGFSDKIKFLVADAEHLPFKDKSFDVVISSHVLEHLPDFDKGLFEIKRVMKKRALIAMPTCLNLCSFAQLGGDNFWQLSKRSFFALPLGFFQVVKNILHEGVDEHYAGMRELSHISRYPWVIKNKLRKAGFKIIYFEAESLCLPYFNFSLPFIRLLDKFKSAPILRNFGYGILFVLENLNFPDKPN